MRSLQCVKITFASAKFAYRPPVIESTDINENNEEQPEEEPVITVSSEKVEKEEPKEIIEDQTKSENLDVNANDTDKTFVLNIFDF